REDEVHRRGAGGEHLLPLRDLYMRRRPAHDRDDQRCACEAMLLEFDLLRIGVGVIVEESLRDYIPRAQARLALEYDEAPRHELAVIGHPRGDRKQRVELSRDRTRSGEFHWFYRAARLQEVNSIRHRALASTLVGTSNQPHSRSELIAISVSPVAWLSVETKGAIAGVAARGSPRTMSSRNCFGGKGCPLTGRRLEFAAIPAENQGPSSGPRWRHEKGCDRAHPVGAGGKRRPCADAPAA